MVCRPLSYLLPPQHLSLCSHDWETLLQTHSLSKSGRVLTPLASLPYNMPCPLQTCQSLPHTWGWNTASNSTAGSTWSGPAPRNPKSCPEPHLSLPQEIRPGPTSPLFPYSPVTLFSVPMASVIPCTQILQISLQVLCLSPSSHVLLPSATPGRAQNWPGCFMPHTPFQEYPSHQFTYLLIPNLRLPALWNLSYTHSYSAGRRGNF